MTQIKEHNVETGEIIERQMNAEELAELENYKKLVEAETKAEAAKAEAKSALLNRLRITADEAKLLLS
jgi:hypothetical protein